MSQENNFIPEQESYKKITPFRLFVKSNFPFIESTYEALDNYGLYCKIVEYLNDVIANENTVESNVGELYNAFVSLNNYVSDYFDNLDVQEEINKKLDDMATNGQLQSLINNIFSSLQNEIESIASGSPAGVYPTFNDLVSDDPNHNKIYVVLNNGYWYYYNTTTNTWSQGGLYQTSIVNYDKTLTGNNEVPNSKSIGDRINNYYYQKNFFNAETINDNHQYGSSGNVSENANMMCTTEPIPMKQGDRIYYYYGQTAQQKIKRIIKCDNYGNFISSATASTLFYWTADEDCFIKMNIDKTGNVDYLTKSLLVINQPPESDEIDNNFYFRTNEMATANEISIEDVTIQHNYFDINGSILSAYIGDNGSLVQRSQNDYLATNLIKCKNGDVFRCGYFGETQTQYGFYQVLKYNNNKQLIERANVNSATYNCNFDGYLRFNLQKGASDEIDGHLIISKNEIITEYFDNKKYLKPTNVELNKNIKISKVSTNNYLIQFGEFNVSLFKTDNGSTNQNNWNLKEIKRGSNVIVPTGTDIIGPVKINDNTDYIGGIHGDETTDDIKIAIDGNVYDIDDINILYGNSITITMKSSVYDQIELDKAFDRFITIIIENQKIHISNTFKASKNLILKRATNGGLIACQNQIIDSIIFNNAYFSSAPETEQNIASKMNTCATINTIYGSVTVNNIKGHELDNYSGFLQVFENETPKRNKIYFDTYKTGNYSITTGDLISGEFEYVLS